MKETILKYLPTAEQVVDILTKPPEANISRFFARQAWLLARRCVGISWHKMLAYDVLAYDAGIISVSEID
jgi:hypothetical protein